MRKYAPVILFVYKRLDKAQTAIQALETCQESEKTDLIIFADGYKSIFDKEEVLAVQQFVENYYRNNSHFRKVILYSDKHNKGLANSIIHGVKLVLEEYKKAIIIEDDLIVSKDFINYMNNGLEYYENDLNVGAIGGFTPMDRKISINPNGALKSRLGCCLGWATWLDRWDRVDWNINNYCMLSNQEKKRIDKIQYGFTAMLKQQEIGTIDSWAVRWDYHFFKHDLWTIYPNQSKVRCVGFDDMSTHANDVHDKRKKVLAVNEEIHFCELELLPNVSKEMRNYFKPTIFEKIRYFVKHNKV